MRAAFDWFPALYRTLIPETPRPNSNRFHGKLQTQGAPGSKPTTRQKVHVSHYLSRQITRKLQIPLR